MKNFWIPVALVLIITVAFRVHSQNSLNVSLEYHWEDTSLVGSFAFDNVYNEVWGFVEDGIEYGVIGTTAGTHIFDLSDPQNIYEAVFIPGKVQGGQVIHRDYHDFDGYLYIVCDEGPSTFRIADLSFLPDSAPIVYDSDAFFSRAHNIFIDVNKKKLYACGNLNPGKPLMVFDISNPESPMEIGHLNFNEAVHDIFVRNDTAYINVGNSGLFVYEFSDASNPSQLAVLNSYPYQGYNHAGWLSNDGKTYVMADETWGTHVKIIDVSDLSNINVRSTVFSNVDTNLSIPHNVMLRDNYLFISHYYDGLYIYDISDPDNP
ncbi:MAG: choice-of-anchor B family protein, partial [Flavobacteriales bacterium]|nr:choice-of-anchor B family protein [Flavobacteriales bacterium]